MFLIFIKNISYRRIIHCNNVKVNKNTFKFIKFLKKGIKWEKNLKKVNNIYL